MKGRHMGLEVCKVLYRAAYVKVFQFRGVALTPVQPRRVMRHALSSTTVVIPNEEIRPLAENGIEGSPCAGYDCCRILNHLPHLP